MANQGKARPKTTRKNATKAPPRGPNLDARGLNPKQARFVDEYLIDLNGTQAAIRAGYSAKTAEQQATRLLRNAQISAAVEAGKAKRAKKVEISAERVLTELAKLAFSDVRKVAKWDAKRNELLPSDEIDDDAAATIESIANTESGVKITLHSKTRALELLGKHLGLFVDRVKIENPEDIARAIAAAQSAIDSSGAFPAPPAAEKAA